MHMICYFINLTKLLFFIWQMITSRAADCNCTTSNAGQIPTIDFLLLYFVQLSSFIYCIYGCLCALYLTYADLHVVFFVCQFVDNFFFFLSFFSLILIWSSHTSLGDRGLTVNEEDLTIRL